MRPDQMPRQPDGELAGLPAVQRWHATGDYAYPAEEREDGEFVAYDDHRAELLRLARENAILTAKNRGTLANNLCPDHRDKQTGKSCLACTIETLTRQKERAESERDALRKRIDDAPVGHPVSVDFSEMTLTVTIPNGFRTNGWPFALVPLDDAEAKG